MRSVANLIKELKKFPKDAMCYGYEGEFNGIGVKKGEKAGFIYAGEGHRESLEKETETLK